VVILRYDTGKTLGGRSGCPSCDTTLSWSELIPLVSFVFQRGKCRSCSESISWQYFIVEFGTGILFLLTHLHLFTGVFDAIYIVSILFYFIVLSLLIVITVYDYYHKIIPDPFVFTLIALGALTLFVSPSLTIISPDFWHILAAPILFSPFALLWLVSRGRWMGFGDAKLAWAFGWLLGISQGITAIAFSFWIGALYFLFLIALQRLFLGGQHLKMNSEVPFGPFLVLGFLLVLFTELDLLAITLLI